MIGTLRKALRNARRAWSRAEPLITIRVSREALLHNLRAYRERYPGLAVAPVLKSDAYGHGLVVAAELLDREGIAFFMVDSLYEAKRLRAAGIRSRILVMGYARPAWIAESRLPRVDFAITDIEQLRELASSARRPVRLHLKVDTGMHRQGILPADLDEAIALVRSNPCLRVVGVATHLGDADGPDESFSRAQLGVWKESVERVRAAFPDLEHVHAAATKGARFGADFPMDTLRLGIGLYGIDTAPGHDAPLRPVLSMRSSVSSIREIPAGEAVGYNATWRAARPSRIATVPAGYYEGIDRGLSSVGSFEVRGTPCPIAGRVSMNMTSIDVTDLPDAVRGDAVTLISDDPANPCSVQSMAALAGTSPYVILAHLPAHLKRVVA